MLMQESKLSIQRTYLLKVRFATGIHPTKVKIETAEIPYQIDSSNDDLEVRQMGKEYARQQLAEQGYPLGEIRIIEMQMLSSKG